MNQEKLSKMELPMLTQLLLDKKLSNNHKQMILQIDTKPKLKPLQREELLLLPPEMIKQEVELKYQETQEDGDLYGQLVHFPKLQMNQLLLKLQTLKSLSKLLLPKEPRKQEEPLKLKQCTIKPKIMLMLLSLKSEMLKMIKEKVESIQLEIHLDGLLLKEPRKDSTQWEKKVKLVSSTIS